MLLALIQLLTVFSCICLPTLPCTAALPKYSSVTLPEVHGLTKLIHGEGRISWQPSLLQILLSLKVQFIVVPNYPVQHTVNNKCDSRFS